MSDAEPRLLERRELWRTDYRKDAYTDQTGARQWGYVVLGRVVVHDVEIFEQDEPYTRTRHRSGIRALDDAGNAYLGYANLVDTWGGRHWCAADGSFWAAPPHSLAGYVLPDGTPVRRLLEER